jgi:hypothetical protein
MPAFSPRLKESLLRVKVQRETQTFPSGTFVLPAQKRVPTSQVLKEEQKCNPQERLCYQLVFHVKESLQIAACGLELSFFFCNAEFLRLIDYRTCLAIADTPAFEQKYLSTLGAFPWEKSKFGINVLLHESVARNSRELYFRAFGAHFL